MAEAVSGCEPWSKAQSQPDCKNQLDSFASTQTPFQKKKKTFAVKDPPPPLFSPDSSSGAEQPGAAAAATTVNIYSPG